MERWWTVILFMRENHVPFKIVKEGKISKKRITKISNRVGRQLDDVAKTMFRHVFQKEKPKY